MNLGTRCSSGRCLAVLFVLAMAVQAQTTQPASKYTPQDGDFVLRDFHFKSGETMPELRMHYMTLGKPVRDCERASHQCRAHPARNRRLGS